MFQSISISVRSDNFCLSPDGIVENANPCDPQRI